MLRAIRTPTTARVGVGMSPPPPAPPAEAEASPLPFALGWGELVELLVETASACVRLLVVVSVGESGCGS